jgi:hypothetical protein
MLFPHWSLFHGTLPRISRPAILIVTFFFWLSPSGSE